VTGRKQDRAPAVTARRRIMLFADSFVHGGTERQFVEALKNLDSGRYEVLVGCLKRQGPFLEDVAALGLSIHEMPVHSLRGWPAIRWVRSAAGFFRRNRIELVHAFDFYTTLLCVPAARLAGVPVLASRRDVVRSGPWALRTLLRFVCGRAQGVVANSRAAAAPLSSLSRAWARKVHLIYNGADPRRLVPAAPRETTRLSLGFAPENCVVGTVAALREEKSVDVFIRAAALASRELPSAGFLVVGDGPERPRLEALARELGVAYRMHFAGDRRDVPDFLAAMDAFVLSSSTESFPNAVLEAMAAGRAVVATRVGGTPELIEEGVNGYLVPVGDAEALARRMIELSSDPGRCERMGRAGYERVARDFTPRRMAEKLEGLYDQLLRRARPTARVLQISNYPPPVCGWALHTQLVDRALQQRGADARVMDIGPGRRLEGRECIPVHSALDYLAKLVAYRLQGFAFQMHVNGDSWKGYLMALAAVLLARVTGKPAALTFHAGPSQLYFPRAGSFWHWAFRLLFHLSGPVVCNHEPVRKLIVGYGVPEEKVHPIPAFSVQYAEEIPVPLPPAVESFLQAHRPRIFSYSLFRPEFTIEALFAAFAAVRERYPNAGLLLAGPKETPPEAVAGLKRLGIEPAVLIPGNMAHAEFLTAVQRSDVFVRTHLRDGVCTSVLEALQLGVPVVAAEDGLRPPSVITFAPGDAGALARAVTGVLADLPAARARVQRPGVDNHLDDEVALLLRVGQSNHPPAPPRSPEHPKEREETITEVPTR